jgi:hypothetical protein
MHDATRLRRAIQEGAVFGAWALAFGALAGCSGHAERSEPRAEYRAEVVNPDFSGGMLLPDGRTLLVWGTDGTLLRSHDGEQWSHVETTSAADLAAAAADSTGKVLIAVGQGGTILRSVDGARSFHTATNETTDTDLRAVAWHAASGAWIATGTAGRILRSNDDGRSWTPVSSGATVDFHTLFVDPETRHVLIGGDLGTLGISRDGGQAFSLTTPRWRHRCRRSRSSFVTASSCSAPAHSGGSSRRRTMAAAGECNRRRRPRCSSTAPGIPCTARSSSPATTARCCARRTAGARGKACSSRRTAARTT